MASTLVKDIQPPVSQVTPANSDAPPPFNLEPLESLIDVKRIGAWRKICGLYQSLSDKALRERCLTGAALLLEGFLAFGGKKIEAYQQCRGTLCHLMVTLQFTNAPIGTITRCFEATAAVQSLIINMARRKQKVKPEKSDAP